MANTSHTFVSKEETISLETENFIKTTHKNEIEFYKEPSNRNKILEVNQISEIYTK